jgi:hypothetical protein
MGIISTNLDITVLVGTNRPTKVTKSECKTRLQPDKAKMQVLVTTFSLALKTSYTRYQVSSYPSTLLRPFYPCDPINK